MGYLELTDEEEAVLAKAKELRGEDGKIIVIINANNVMELGELQDDPMVDAILYVGGPGKAGFYAISDVLSGAVCPSGRLADTYPADLLASPVTLVVLAGVTGVLLARCAGSRKGGGEK